MNDTQTEDPTALAHKEEVAGVLPALAQLDRIATELNEKAASGQEVTTADVNAYEQQAAHARHLVDAIGTDHREVAEAEKDHRGDGEKGFATRAMDHATHPLNFEANPPAADNAQARAHDDEEIDL